MKLRILALLLALATTAAFSTPAKAQSLRPVGVGLTGDPDTPYSIVVTVHPAPVSNAIVVRGALKLQLDLEREGRAEVSIHTVDGRQVARHDFGVLAAGRTQVRLDETARLRPGMYFAHFASTAGIANRKIIVLP